MRVVWKDKSGSPDCTLAYGMTYTVVLCGEELLTVHADDRRVPKALRRARNRGYANIGLGIINRRSMCTPWGRRVGDKDAHKDRRVLPPRDWCLHKAPGYLWRRKGDERRDPIQYGYASSRDIRIRALERRKS